MYHSPGPVPGAGESLVNGTHEIVAVMKPTVSQRRRTSKHTNKQRPSGVKTVKALRKKHETKEACSFDWVVAVAFWGCSACLAPGAGSVFPTLLRLTSWRESKSSMVDIFTPQTSANTTNQGSVPLPEPVFKLD